MASAAAARATSATSPPTTPPVKRARIAAVADTKNGSRKSPDPEGWTEAVQVADPSNIIPLPPKSALFVSPSSEAIGRLPAAVDGTNADSNASSSGIDSGFSDSGGGSDSPPPASDTAAAAPETEGSVASPVVGPEFGGCGVSNASSSVDVGTTDSPQLTMSTQPRQESSGVNEVEGGQAEATVAVVKEGSNAPLPASGVESVESPNDEAPTTSAGDQDSASDVSEISGLSGANWKPEAGPFSWVQSQMIQGRDPRILLHDMLSSDVDIPDDLDQMTLWRIILNLLTEPERRKKLEHVNTIEDVVGLIAKSKNIIVLTGAGVSVSCGIPDFRSKDGVYARLAVDFPDLPDPQAMFDIQYFRKDPRPFFKFAREIYPGQFQPSPCHKFIKALEQHGKLLRNYTQNIDTLEQVVGIERVVQCHGSFATASCTKCKRKVEAEEIREDIFDQRIPLCPVCRDRIEAYKQIQNIETSSPPSAPPSQQPLTTTTVTAGVSEPSGQRREQQQRGDDTFREENDEPNATESATADPMLQPGIMKPDIVFFGEGLGDEFHNSVARDKERADLLIMVGSSLKVRPVALIPSSVPKDIPQVLINREPLPHIAADVELLGDCDVIVDQLCRMLGWERLGDSDLEETRELLEKAEDKSVREWQERKREEEERRQELEQVQNSETSAVATEAESLPENPPSEVSHLDPTPFWQHRERKSLATRLPDSKYFYHPPSRYVFPGAEIYSDDESDGDSDSSDDDSTVDGNDGDDNIEETTTRKIEQAEQEQEQNQNECASGREDEQRGQQSIQ